MADVGSSPTTEVMLNEKNFEVLVAKFVPTSQYFERSFQMLQSQMNDFKEDQKELKADINRRFEQVNQGQKDIRLEMDRRFEQVNQGQKDIRLEMDRRFEQVNQGQKDIRLEMDKRFEQVDKRFEQVDKRFEQVNAKLDTIIERMDVKIDAGLRETRSMSIRLFSFAMIFSAISMAGFLAKMTGLF